MVLKHKKNPAPHHFDITISEYFEGFCYGCLAMIALLWFENFDFASILKNQAKFIFYMYSFINLFFFPFVSKKILAIEKKLPSGFMLLNIYGFLASILYFLSIFIVLVWYWRKKFRKEVCS